MWWQRQKEPHSGANLHLFILTTGKPLLTHYRLVEHEVSLLFKRKRQHKPTINLTEGQRDGLEALRNDKSAVFQSADKEGAVDILVRSVYESDIQRQLSNTF